MTKKKNKKKRSSTEVKVLDFAVVPLQLAIGLETLSLVGAVRL